MSALAPLRLTPLEVACGIVLGSGAPAAQSHDGPTPIAAFERAVLEALLHPPCLVSFSGGRDSSAVLAVATRVARREGLPLPIPATNRFARVQSTDELAWQELVVTQLGLSDWFRNDVEDELDCVGPVAVEVLVRHGLLWPFNAFFHVPLLQAARGGALLTGIGGDETLGGSRWARAYSVLSGRARPRPRDALRVALALAPPSVRAPAIRRRLDVRMPWLRPASFQAVLDAFAAQESREPFGWATDFHWWRTLRAWQVAERSLGLLAADADAMLVHPFADPGFAGALAHLPRRRRFVDRSAAMALLFGDVLPASVLQRVDKATFDGAFFNGHSRRLAASWGGEGADPAHVDARLLRETWSSPAPDARSFLLLQAAWLERAGEGAQRPSAGGGNIPLNGLAGEVRP